MTGDATSFESRAGAMLATLEEQLRSAETHEQKMRAALVESESWALADDRDWIKEAVAEAEQMRADAEARLEQGRRIVARTIKDVPRESRAALAGLSAGEKIP